MINGHGDDSYTYQRKMVSNFSSNAYSGLNLSGLKNYLAERIEEVISVYPEPEAYSLEKRLAEVLNLQATEVCVTNGATEAIYLIAQAFKGSVSGICMPTFSEYADACCIHGHRISSLYDLKQWNENVQLVWLCNPNNPTGAVRDKEMLSELIYRHPNTYFIIDQAYEDFTLESLFTPAEAISFSNVILLHSMTKRFSIPGLRLGYITAPEHLLTNIRTQRMPWSVNALAIEAGMYFLKHSYDYPIDLSAYLQETARLSSALSSSGYLEVWPTDTHYMLIRLRMGKASALKDYLANEHGMLIRDASNFEGLDEGFFRIAAQTPAENDALVAAISQWVENE